MISSQNLIDKICCTLTTGGLTAVQCCQAENALTLLCQPVFSVANIATLPNATTYNGRMVYVDNENKYYYAVQGIWSDDFSSVPHEVNSFSTYSWGAGFDGSLGDNTTTNRFSPVSVVGGFIDWCQISAGGEHSLAVRQNGTAWAWGCNGQGRLGDNTTVSKSSPVSVVGGFCDWCQISGSSSQHSLGVRTNGTAWAWGEGSAGRLGDNTTVDKSSPVSVVGGFTDWCQVSAGTNHSLGVRTGGTAWAWGYNLRGQLGNNSTTATSSPVSVLGGFTDWCQISAGTSFSLAVRQNGTAWAWGCNGSGQLGINSCFGFTSPRSVVGGFCDWCQVSAGSVHSLGVRTGGTAWAWGYGGTGRLGNNCTTNRSSPVSVIGGFTDWCQISAGGNHSLGVRQNSTAWAWGCNGSGRLGDNTGVNKSSPVSVAGGFCDWCQISAGGDFSLAIKQATVGL
jgi:alpha-tubulin suppressor-like RCC1 family protein